MQALEVQTFLSSLNGGWVDPTTTVDTFKAGDPRAEVRGIAVAWMSYRWALEQAMALGCNMFVTHEPTYYSHRDADQQMLPRPATQAKRQFIEQSGLVILRCHDLWDQLPDIGIADAWGRLLGLGPAIAGQGFYRVYAVGGRTALDVARQVAVRTQPLGQEAIQLIGPPGHAVTRLAVGIGALTPLMKFIDDYQADLALCTDDGLVYWRDAAYAIDNNLPVIVVNHAVSEVAGIECLARRLQTQFPQIPVHYLAQQCMYQLVTGDTDSH
jgi:NIF3 (NGG1p interacting factor 3) protein